MVLIQSIPRISSQQYVLYPIHGRILRRRYNIDTSESKGIAPAIRVDAFFRKYIVGPIRQWYQSFGAYYSPQCILPTVFSDVIDWGNRYVAGPGQRSGPKHLHFVHNLENIPKPSLENETLWIVRHFQTYFWSLWSLLCLFIRPVPRTDHKLFAHDVLASKP